MLTSPYNVYPLTPQFYIEKNGVYRGIPYFLLFFFALKHRLCVFVRTASLIYVLSKNKKNITIFYLKIIIFTALKYCSILHDPVFVMCLLSGERALPFELRDVNQGITMMSKKTYIDNWYRFL